MARIVTLSLKSPRVEVFFSPKGGCADTLIAAIAKAKKRLRVLVYEFNHKGIGAALVAAHKRGVDVGLIADHRANQDRLSQCIPLAAAGATVLLDTTHRIMHNKVLVVDGRVVWTGSFNFTWQAEKYAENLLGIRSTKLAQAYLDNWDLHAAHSKPFGG